MLGIFSSMLRLFTKWKPDWLYDAMPYVYLVAGFATIIYFDAPTGYGSGILLLIAAVLIWVKRKKNKDCKGAIE